MCKSGRRDFYHEEDWVGFEVVGNLTDEPIPQLRNLSPKLSGKWYFLLQSVPTYPTTHKILTSVRTDGLHAEKEWMGKNI